MNPVSVSPALDLVARAKQVAAVADRFAEEGDRQGYLSPAVVDALHGERMFGMWVPQTVAEGSELDVLSSIGVIETISAGDPSAGWVLMAAALAIGTGAAYLDREAVDRLFAGDRLPVIA